MLIQGSPTVKLGSLSFLSMPCPTSLRLNAFSLWRLIVRRLLEGDYNL